MTLSSAIYVFLGMTQLRSAVAKIRHSSSFRNILRSYPGLVRYSTRLAMLVPTAEISLAIGFLFPSAWTHLGCGYGMVLFLIIASVAIVFRYRRGEKMFACGCSSNLAEELPVDSMLLKNAVFLGSASYAIWRSNPRISLFDYALGAALLLAFDLFNAALVQEGRVRSWQAVG